MIIYKTGIYFWDGDQDIKYFTTDKVALEYEAMLKDKVEKGGYVDECDISTIAITVKDSFNVEIEEVEK